MAEIITRGTSNTTLQVPDQCPWENLYPTGGERKGAIRMFRGSGMENTYKVESCVLWTVSSRHHGYSDHAYSFTEVGSQQYLNVCLPDGAAPAQVTSGSCCYLHRVGDAPDHHRSVDANHPKKASLLLDLDIWKTRKEL